MGNKVSKLPSGFERWKEKGLQSFTYDKWALGDWWNEGHAYGERKAFVESDEWIDAGGPSFQTCMNAGAVARTFPTTSRRREVSFSVHETLCAAPELLDQAASEKWSRATARQKVREYLTPTPTPRPAPPAPKPQPAPHPVQKVEAPSPKEVRDNVVTLPETPWDDKDVTFGAKHAKLRRLSDAMHKAYYLLKDIDENPRDYAEIKEEVVEFLVRMKTVNDLRLVIEKEARK